MELKEFRPERFAADAVRFSRTLEKLGLTDQQKNQIAHEMTNQFEWAVESYIETTVNNVALKKALKAPLRVRDYKAMLTQAVGVLEKLKTWAPEAGPSILKGCKYFTKGDEDAPFFTETFLYLTIGKEDARSLLGYMRTLAEAVGGVARHETGF